ncbi:TNF receptor-associated factor 4-like [Oppia nitens]|uniref:TNF receptor-associated factor 4-like n=1 Tax=Oppia nitens TaxID=1686743 RepID=UPI0023DC60AE|nr:TNF receptor-associated factor 4-like [Oppia nitens]XP_054164622.1 TNF receptor-associated factor 4-like [Oppia nitens]XP_054164623.1 TNF receptor-associated factor 4-like [Oppia nitens]
METNSMANSELILEKEVHCSHKGRGCRKIMALSELEGHMKSCSYGLVHCPLKCGQAIIIKILPEHMAKMCPRRIVQCKYCDEDISFNAREEHESCCPEKPVSCHYCHKQTIQQKDLKSHMENCPLKPTNCKLKQLGCKFTGLKSEVDEHESNWSSHMDIVIKHILQSNTPNGGQAKNRLADVVQIVKNLNTENSELTDRANELSERVEALETTNKSLTEQLTKLETIQKADIASMRTVIELLRKELEEFKTNVVKQREEDEESEV